MLGRPEKGAPLLARKPPPLQPASPPEYTYSAQDPSIESTHVWSDLSEGMGLRIQKGTNDKRYYFADGVDCHVGGYILPGPAVTSNTPTTRDSTNGTIAFFEMSITGTLTLFSLDGRYVLKRTGDGATGWDTVSKDFGVGKAGLDVVVFTANSGSTTYAFVAMGDADNFWYFDGTTWTQHASLKALCWCIVGRELYRASDTNLVAKVDTNTDPLTAGNWSATNSFRVGDKTSTITRMVTNDAGILLIFKSDGAVYALDVEGNDVQLYADLKGAPDATNGRWHWKHKGNLHVTMSGQHSRIMPDLSVESGIGPEKYTENNSDVHGYVTAGVGTQFCAYAGLWSPDYSEASLMVFGGYAKAADDPDPKPLDVWHGSIVPYGAAPFDSKVTAMIRSSVGADTAHERVYIGFANGKRGWFHIPCTANPRGCASYDFAEDGFVYLPQAHMGFPADEKFFRTGLVAGPNFAASPGPRVGFSYSENADNGSPWTDIGGAGAVFDATPAERLSFGTTVAEPFLDFRLRLFSQAVVTGAAVTFMVRPPVKLIYQFSIICEDGLVKRDGVPFRRTAKQIRDEVRGYVDTRGSVTVTLPDESSQSLVLTDYQEGYAWDDRTESWRTALQVTAVQGESAVTIFAHGSGL
jgi:hypothetical protein